MRNVWTCVKPQAPHDADQAPSREVKRRIHEVTASGPRQSNGIFRGSLLPRRRCSVVPWMSTTNINATTAPLGPNDAVHTVRPNANQVSAFSSHLRDIPDADHVLSSSDRNSNQENVKTTTTMSKQFSGSKTTQIRVFGYSLSPVYDFWERLQVSHCGQYSVERMLALDEYCQRVSLFHVLAVCFLFPLGPLVVVILIECMPLQPVEKGALANYVFWIRHTMIGTILIVCAMSQAKVWIPEMALTMRQVVVVAIGSAVMYTSLNILIAQLWVFPIPFLIVAGAPLMFTIWAVASRIALGPHPMRGIANGNFRGRRFLLLTSVHAALLGIYPAYQAIFLAVDGGLQLLVMASMPVLNLALKNLQTAWGSQLEDSLPAVIVFTCDVFGTIYSVLCMHSANSMKMVAVTITLNAFVVVMTLHGMNRRSRVARACRAFHGSPFQQLLMERAQSLLLASYDTESLSSLVIATVKLLQVPGQLDPSELHDIRLLSGIQHRISEANSALLASLGSRSIYNNDRRPSKTVTIRQMKAQYASSATEGRKLSSSIFVVPPPPRSKLFRRLQAALIVPVASSRFKLKPRGRFRSLRSFRHENHDIMARVTDSYGSNIDILPNLPLQPRKSSSLLFSSSLRLDSSIKRQRISLSSGNARFTPEGLEASSKLLPVVRISNPVIGGVLDARRRQNTRAVKQTLQLLFNNEYLGLIAYEQCFIPVIYLLYMPVLQRMPNHLYYPTHYRYFGDSNEFDDRMTVIAALAALQFTAFVSLQVFASRRFGVSTIYQVAFVLESQFLFLQGRLLIWLMFAVQSTLIHYGADFTFQFAWVKHTTTVVHE